jgi:hypothetical protein
VKVTPVLGFGQLDSATKSQVAASGSFIVENDRRVIDRPF